MFWTWLRRFCMYRFSYDFINSVNHNTKWRNFPLRKSNLRNIEIAHIQQVIMYNKEFICIIWEIRRRDHTDNFSFQPLPNILSTPNCNLPFFAADKIHIQRSFIPSQIRRDLKWREKKGKTTSVFGNKAASCVVEHICATYTYFVRNNDKKTFRRSEKKLCRIGYELSSWKID